MHYKYSFRTASEYSHRLNIHRLYSIFNLWYSVLWSQCTCWDFFFIVDEMAGRMVDQQRWRLETAPSAGRLYTEWRLRLRQGRLARSHNSVRRVRHMRPAEGGPAERHDQVFGAKGRRVSGNGQAVVVGTRTKSVASVVHRWPDRLQP